MATQKISKANYIVNDSDICPMCGSYSSDGGVCSRCIEQSQNGPAEKNREIHKGWQILQWIQSEYRR